MEALREAMSREMLVRFEALSDWPAERELLVAEHLMIAEKIQARDGAGAAAAMSRHIRGFYGRALRGEAEPLRASVAG